MLEIDYPIMLAGMGSMGKATPPALVAAVSNSGSMGVIGGPDSNRRQSAKRFARRAS